jgi:hypothetical protein
MNTKTYCAVTAVVFAFVAIMHLVRALQAWPVTIGSWSAPVALSWCAVLVGASLSVWAMALLRAQR